MMPAVAARQYTNTDSFYELGARVSVDEQVSDIFISKTGHLAEMVQQPALSPNTQESDRLDSTMSRNDQFADAHGWPEMYTATDTALDDHSIPIRRQKEAPAPLQLVKDRQQGYDGALLSPATPAMISSSYDTNSQYNTSQHTHVESYDSDRLASNDNSSHVQESRDDESSLSTDHVPLRQSSRRSADDETDRSYMPAALEGVPTNQRLLSDGTPIPAMPPIPQSTQSNRSRKARVRRNRSPVLSFDGAVAEEELKLSEWQVLQDDPRRISTLGPKVKRNAPAPWELGGEDQVATGQRLASMELPGKPSARMKSRPSADSFNPLMPLPMSARFGPRLRFTEESAEKENDIPSLFASQRSRSKSVSNSAVGMLKGLGLAAASSAPASTKAKLSKALRLVGGGNEDSKISAPLKNVSSGPNLNGLSAPALSIHDDVELPQSPSSRTITSDASASRKGPTDLIDLVMSADAKYKDQACSPPLHLTNSGRFATSPMGSARPVEGSPRPSGLSATSSENVSSLHQSSSQDSSVSRVTTRPSESEEGRRSNQVEKAELGAETTLVFHQPEQASVTSPSPLASWPSPMPLPGNIEGIPYKLISLEQAREQARLRQSEWLATAGGAAAMQTSASMMSTDTFSEDAIGFKDGVSDYFLSSGKMFRNKKSGFLRKMKKEKGSGGEPDVTSASNTSSKDTEYTNNARMPSFSVTSLDDEIPTGLAATSPALSIRPVSSMFSGFTADFLDASALFEGHGRETSDSTTSSTSGLLMPQSPAISSLRSPDMSRSSSLLTSEAGRFSNPSETIEPLFHKLKKAEYKSPVDDAAANISINTVHNTVSHHHSATGSSSGLVNDVVAEILRDDRTRSQCSTTSPSVPSFQHTVSSFPDDGPLDEGVEACANATASLAISEEVAQHALNLEAQIRALSEELRELRIQHVGHCTTPSSVAGSSEGDHAQTELQVGSCPNCGCRCAEQRRMQSINDAAVLTGAGILDRGRALKSSKNMVTTGRFGGYTSR